MAAFGRPGQQAFGLLGRHAVAVAEQQQGLPGARQILHDLQAIGTLYLQALFAQEMLGSEIRVGSGLGCGAVLEDLFIGREFAQQVDAEQTDHQQ